jgi:hypothetical protein
MATTTWSSRRNRTTATIPSIASSSGVPRLDGTPHNFTTKGAAGVEAADLDGDGDLDLVFACFKDEASTSTESMVFLRGPSGFNGTSPSFKLQTKGARAVAVGDYNDDTRADLVFANSRSGGASEIDSWIYWGKVGGGFDPTPTELPTIGAEDVKVADLEGDGDLDIVFANAIDNALSREVSSYVYLNDGSGGFALDAEVPTVGAVAIAIGDLDKSGRKDLVYACHYNGSSYSVNSVVYLGTSTGWSNTPDIELPTIGASDVMIVQLTKVGHGGYMSKTIRPEDPANTGAFHTFMYNAVLGASQSGRIQLIDASTEEVLADTSLQPGPNEWIVEGAFHVKEHPSIRVVVIAEGLDQPGEFEVDDLWLNWTKRVKRPPEVLDLSLSTSVVYRMRTVTLWFNATDEYDPPRDLLVLLEHRLNGTTTWKSNLLRPLKLGGEVWTSEVVTRADTPVGVYDFRASVRDSDNQFSGYVEFPSLLEVMNNLPSAPEVSITPARAVTTSTLQVEIVRAAQDIESSGLSYRYQWYIDGDLKYNLTTDFIDASLTRKGQNWSVEVRAFDGEDEGLPGLAWRVIHNAAPVPKDPLPDPEIDEDTVDTNWLNLMGAFEDPDGDPITWSVNPEPLYIEVEIDDATGQVTLRPNANWNGRENVTFVASDGELHATQTVAVIVQPVNDIPRFVTINGNPIDQDPMEFTIKQDQVLTLDVLVVDVEDNGLVFDTNTSFVEVDSATGDIRFEPDNDAVGTLHFSLTVWDIVSASEKVTVNFKVVVENVNDIMEDPRITNPSDGDKFLVNQSFLLSAFCSDPDTLHGQVLNYTWTSNVTGLLGYGPSLTVRLLEPGVHILTVMVKDGEFEKTARIAVVIEEEKIDEPDPTDGDEDDKPLNYGLIAIIVVVLVILGAVFYVTAFKRRTEKLEKEDEETFREEEKREGLRRTRDALKDAADEWEAELEEAQAEREEPKEVAVEGTVEFPASTLTMEAKETEEASQDVQALFDDMETEEPAVDEAELEEMRLDNLKRKYQNAIGRLPYGIPSEKLKDMDWVKLAAILATGEKKKLPDGMEITEIDGRWYYSDDKDSSTFLKEHGAKPKEEEPKEEEAVETAPDKAKLLAKLEERFIMGEISEDSYNELKRKYGG